MWPAAFYAQQVAVATAADPYAAAAYGLYGSPGGLAGMGAGPGGMPIGSMAGSAFGGGGMQMGGGQLGGMTSGQLGGQGGPLGGGGPLGSGAFSCGGSGALGQVPSWSIPVRVRERVQREMRSRLKRVTFRNVSVG